MRHSDFKLGEDFRCEGHPYRVTDIGKRVIIAIPLNHPDDPSWYDGPPYAAEERVFDEYSMTGCSME
jgi:hypothetical protein